MRVLVKGDIPENRLLCLAGGDEASVRLAKAEEAPDFFSTTALKDGDRVDVRFRDRRVWRAEASEDIREGISLEVTDGGRVREMRFKDGVTRIGYSLRAAKAGEVVEYMRLYKVGPDWIQKVDGAIKGGGA